MKIFGEPTVYGVPQLNWSFERCLIISCLLGAAIVLVLALLIQPAAASGAIAMSCAR